MARTAVLIGGTGYLGGGIGRILTAHGIAVISVGRAEFDVLTRPIAALTRLLAGADLVVNAAGALWQATDQQMEVANIVLVQRLLDAVDAMDRPVPIVQLGSVYEYGAAPHGRSVDESASPRPQSAYGRSKLAATECLTRWHGPGVVLRCSTVVGARAPRASLLGSVAHRLAEPVANPTGPSILELPPLGGTVDVLDLRDLGAAVLAADRWLSRDTAAAVDIVNVASGVRVPVEYAVQRLVELSALPVRVVSAEGPGSPRATANGAPSISIEKAYRQWGWSPRFDLDDALRELWRYTSEARTGTGNN